jgi:hypothetical protein
MVLTFGKRYTFAVGTKIDIPVQAAVYFDNGRVAAHARALKLGVQGSKLVAEAQLIA